MLAKNMNFDLSAPKPHLGIITSGGELAIGTGDVQPLPEILAGNIVSTTLTVGYSSPNITIETMGSGQPIEQITVDNSTVPGTNPVLPTALGNVTITGGQIAASSLANVIQTHSFAANSFAVTIQRSSAVAASDPTQNGVSHFNSTQFTIDANGFVEASGTGLGQTITGNTGGALPPTAGNWNIIGTSTNGIQTDGVGSTLTPRFNSPYADGDFSFESQVGGATRTFTVQNTVDAASSASVNQVGVAGTTSDYSLFRLFEGANNSWGIGFQAFDPTVLNHFYAPTGTVTPSTSTNNPLRMFITGGTGAVNIRSALVVASEGEKIGATVRLHVQNPEVAANSDVEILLETANPALGGGSQSIRWGSPGQTQFSMGQSKDATAATQPLEIKSGGFPAGTNLVQIHPAGEINYPLLPAFLATHATAQNNVTGAAAIATIINDNEIFDQNSNYNPATGIFTAPITGRYQFSGNVRIDDAATATAGVVILVTSNRTYLGVNEGFVLSAGVVTFALHISVLADMDLGDTAVMQVQVIGMAGNTADISNIQSGTYFSGFMAA